MSRTVPILATLSVGLAVTAAYLAYQLHATREELRAQRMSPAPAAAAAPREVRVPPALVSAATAPEDPRKHESDAETRKAQSVRDANHSSTLHDPDMRARQLREIRSGLEKSFRGLRQYLDLTEDEYNRLLDIFSEQQVRNNEAISHCTKGGGCDFMSIAASQRHLNRRQLEEFMGAEKAQRFRDYLDNFVEREAVANFRGRLPDALRLTDTQAEKLTEVLGEERRRMQKEWEQLGTKFAGIQGQYGSLFYPVTAQGVEHRVAEASEFLRRQRERAAEVLTAAQLEAFTQIQQDLLEEARNGWESGTP